MRKRKTIQYVVTSILSFLLFLPANVFAIGQLTKPVFLSDILRGQVILQEMLVFNTDREAQRKIALSASGDLEQWTEFYLPNDMENAIDSLLMDAGDKTNVIAQITIPDDIPNGTYGGNLTVGFRPDTKDSQNEGVSLTVGQKIDRAVSIIVTDKEIIAFKTSVIPKKYLMEGQDPLDLRFIFKNTGNIVINPDVQLKITEDKKSIHNSIYPYPEEEEPIKPLARHEINIKWPTVGLNGKYRAEIIVKQGDRVYHEESFRFYVGEAGKVLSATFSENGDNGQNGASLLKKILIGVGGTLVILLFVVIGILIQRKAKRRGNKRLA